MNEMVLIGLLVVMGLAMIGIGISDYNMNKRIRREKLRQERLLRLKNRMIVNEIQKIGKGQY